MTLWTVFQHFFALEALMGTALALWIGLLVWRGPTKPLRRRFKRISRPIQLNNTMSFRRGHHF